MSWNVHLDGLERTRDLIVEREGVFKECIAAIRMAKILGYQVATNTTVYKETEMSARLEQISIIFSGLAWTGIRFHPATTTMPRRKICASGLIFQPENFFLTRAMTKGKFREYSGQWGEAVYVLRHPRSISISWPASAELTCSAWAIPTRNVRGWKAPCYLMTDGHYSSYRHLLEKTEFGQIWRCRWRGARQAL